jgi:SAM-dependent methyltransferase
MNSDWLSFWDKPHCIYVNARHKNVHYRLIAREIAQQIAALLPSRLARVLDYGCGEALHADIVAAVAGELLLCDGAPAVRAGVAARFAGNSKVRALAPADVERLPNAYLDLVVLHSVAQYLTRQQAQTLLVLFHRLLQPGGFLLVSDVIPTRARAATDAAALLRFAVGNGFLIAALAGLTRTAFSDYRRLLGRPGLTRYSEAQMIEDLAAAGFAARRAKKNLGHNGARMAFIARPR